MATQQTTNNRYSSLLLEIANETGDRDTLNKIVATLIVRPGPRTTEDVSILKAALGNKSIGDSTVRIAKQVEEGKGSARNDEICDIISKQLAMVLRREENTMDSQGCWY
ncbi:MAG: hypothetical protein KGI06_03510 [Candidatus Micrarchaeota archaeon]|nr:hypothetical protein [Candidatus Micrarchaeota archaeon]